MCDEDQTLFQATIKGLVQCDYVIPPDHRLSGLISMPGMPLEAPAISFFQKNNYIGYCYVNPSKPLILGSMEIFRSFS